MSNRHYKILASAIVHNCKITGVGPYLTVEGLDFVRHSIKTYLDMYDGKANEMIGLYTSIRIQHIILDLNTPNARHIWPARAINYLYSTTETE